MSTEQSVDPELVEQTKQQIRNLVREIAQLSKSELSQLEYYDAVLNRIVTALAAVGGAVWTVGDGGRLELEYQINLRETHLADSQENQMQHAQILRKVITSGEGMLVSPHSGAGDENEGANPTDYLLVLGPLKADQETLGIIEVFQRPGSSLNVQKGYLRFLMQMCELAGDYLKTRSLRHFSDRQTLWAQLENFTRVAHRSLDPRLTAYTIANEGRRLIECDRVSVGICRGKKCVIEAVSGQDTFDKRSNTVSLLSRLATAVTATGESVWFTGDTSMMAPQVEDAVQAYVDDSHSKTVAIIPLKRHQEVSDITDDKELPEVIGALIVEQIEDSKPREGMQQRVEVVSEHSSTALANALEYHSLFLLPLWQTLGKAQWVFKARTLPKTISIAVAVLVLLILLVVFPARFELTGKGTLQPAEKRDVFAGTNGVVYEILVKHGDRVKKGDLLAKMYNNDLASSIEELVGKRAATAAQMESKQRVLNEAKGTLKLAEESRINGEFLELQKAYDSLTIQLEFKRKQQQLLNVVSPIDGEVVTWQLRELLIHRPVQQGQILMTVAETQGDWELEINMPEDRMGHIAYAQSKIKDDLDVSYILATNPGSSHEGSVKEVQRVADVKGEEGNVVLVRVAVDKSDFEDRRPGATATAKIYCGHYPVGYVWFHDIFAFVNKTLFKYF